MKIEVEKFPIDTAPHTGKPVLLFPGCYRGYWQERRIYKGEDMGPGWTFFDCEDHWYSFHHDEEWEPPFTHWMPLIQD